MLAKALRPVRKCKLVDEVRGDWGVSIRRACGVLMVDTSTYHYTQLQAQLAMSASCLLLVDVFPAIQRWVSAQHERGWEKPQSRKLGSFVNNHLDLSS